MTERDNLVAALDAYIQAHLEKYILAKQPESAPVTPAPATTTDRYSTKYDDASRKEIQDLLRSYHLSADGLTDAQLAAQMRGLNAMLIRKNANQ